MSQGRKNLIIAAITAVALLGVLSQWSASRKFFAQAAVQTGLSSVSGWGLGVLGQDATLDLESLTAALKSRSPEIRRLAAEALGKLGPKAAPAVPVMVESARDEDSKVARAISEGVQNIGAEAVPGLLGSLKSENPIHRQTAAAFLRQLGPQAKAAVPDLKLAMADSDEAVRHNVALALGPLDDKGESLEILRIRSQKDPSKYVQEAAKSSLKRVLLSPDVLFSERGKKESDARLVVPELIAALREDDKNRKIWAVQAAVNFREKANGLVPIILEQFPATDPLTQQEFVKSLARIAIHVEPAFIPQVLNIFETGLKTKNPEIRRACIRGSGRPGLDPSGLFRLKHLPRMLDDADPLVRREALSGLVFLKSKAIPSLLKEMAHKKAARREQAAAALAMIGPKAARRLQRELTNKDKNMRTGAALALSLMPAAASPLLLKSIESGEKLERQGAVTAFIFMGHRAIPFLLKAIYDFRRGPKAKRECARWCVFSLGALGKDGRKAVPDLVKLLKDRNSVFHAETLDALMRIGPSHLGNSRLDAVAAATALIKHANPAVRERAVRFLGKAAPFDGGLVNALKALADKDPDRFVKKSAKQAHALVLKRGAPRNG